MSIYFGKYNDIDKYTARFDNKSIVLLSKPPRKIVRRLKNWFYCDAIEVPPYIETGNLLLPEKNIFTLSYVASLITADIGKLDILNNKLLLSSEDTGDYGIRTVVIAYLSKLGFDCIELNAPKDYTTSCEQQFMDALTAVFKFEGDKYTMPLEKFLKNIGFYMFRLMYEKQLNNINNGIYNTRLFEDNPSNLSEEEQHRRLVLSRQEISSIFMKVLLESWENKQHEKSQE